VTIKYSLAFILSILLTIYQGFSQEVIEHHLELNDTQRNRIVPIKVYRPKSTSAVPIIIFSHGLGGNRENNAYLGQHWAQAGYFVVAVQHAGSDTDTLKNAKLLDKLKALKQALSVENAVSRFKDIPFVLDQLEILNRKKGHIFEHTMDLKNIGMSGHSYGAITTLALAGSKTGPLSFKDDRLDAFFAMSPKPSKISTPKVSYGHLKQPILSMTGTKDKGTMVDPNLDAAEREKVYEAMPKGDKYQLVLEGGEHHSFGDTKSFRTRNRNPKHHPAIQVVSLHFFDAYLKQNSKSKKWLQSKDAAIKAGLSSKDKWSWK
jgi:predicted dienelactone hydrolase